MKHFRMLALAAALTVASTAPAVADTPSDPGKAAASYRESVYHVIAWNWRTMGAMVKGEQAFDRADFAKRAARVSFLSHQLDEAYPEGSVGGEAKPEIWQNRADFDAKLDDFQREAQALRVATAGSADEAALKEQFAKVAGTCKACHQDYKAD